MCLYSPGIQCFYFLPEKFSCMRISQGWQTSVHILLKYGVFSWVMPWRLEAPSFHMTSNRAESQSYLPLLSTLFWLAYLTEVLIRVRGRGCIFNPSAKEGRFISVQVMEGGRKRENMARDQLHSMRQWCLEESVTKKEDKSEHRHSAEQDQQHLRVMYGDTGRWTLPSQPALHWALMKQQIYWTVIGASLSRVVRDSG